MAFKITSCIFIIRSISAAGICSSVLSTPNSFSHPLLKRTFHLLFAPDNSHATDSLNRAPQRRGIQLRYNPGDMKGKTLDIAITGVVCVTAILLSNRLGL